LNVSAHRKGNAEAMTEPRSAGDPLPDGCVVMEVRVAELKQLFNRIDPSPFRERDLDPSAEEFIVAWAETAAPGKPLALLVRLERPEGVPEEPAILRDAIRDFFQHESDRTTRQLRQLFRRGRISLAIALFFLAALILLGDLVANAMNNARFGEILREGLLIGGWVAMWRPLEIFLYDWWPIRGQRKLYDRLAKMPVRIAYSDRADADAWRRDWPVEPR
jgi:hypothetical protein